MGVRKVQMSFAAGELSQFMYGRFDDSKYAQGLARCRNFIVRPQGPAVLRPGTSYVNAAKYSDRACRLIPFTFSITQTMVLEFGDKYIRFHTDGQTLLGSNGQPYEVSTPYAADDLFDIHYVQSMDVMTLVHPKYPPKELRRYGATDWRLANVSFAEPLARPGTPTCTYAVVAGDGVTITEAEKTRYTLKYKVTAVKETDTGDEESAASPAGSCLGNLYLNNATVTITWGAVAGATRYRVYKNYQGLYCFIGETEETSFIDDNYEPDAGITPPIYEDPFNQSKGITSVTVTSQGSGYSYSPKGVTVGQYASKATVRSAGAVAYSGMALADFKKLSYTKDPTSQSQGITEPYWSETNDSRYSYPSYPSEDSIKETAKKFIELVDVAGSGNGASYELDFSVSNSRSKTSVVEGDSDVITYHSTTTVTLKGVRITSPGSKYELPVVRVYLNKFLAMSRYNEALRFEYALSVSNQGVNVYITDSTGSGAEVEPTVTNGRITAIRVVYPGSGYSNPRVVISSNGTGSGAAATASAGSAGDYPGAVAYYEQRRCFAGTSTRPQMVWMTRSGTESDMSYTLPSQDDNRLRFRIASQEAARILHLMPLAQLLVLTNSTEYRVSSGGSGPVAPDSIDSKVQAQIGASNVQPVIVNSTLVYPAARGGHVRELGYNYNAGGYVTGDLSIRSTHFFETANPVDMSLAKAPDPIVWTCMSDGSLLGLTYLPEQAIGGWHKHTTENGYFESCAAVAEGDEDILYCVVRRVINGATVRYVERMHERQFDRLEDAFHVDCAGEYQGSETSTISGLTWLEGQTVSILANGCVLPQRVVTDGKVTLTQPSTHVIVGLPITADLQTLPTAVQLSDGSYGTGHMKNVSDVWVRVVQSSGIFIGPDFDNLTEVKQRTTENYGSPPEMRDGEVSALAAASWNDSGQICLRQKDPLPLTIVSVAWDLAA